MSNDSFIDDLVSELTPVRRSNPATIALLLGVLFALPVLFIWWLEGPRRNLYEVVYFPTFILETIVLAAITALALYCALQERIPGRANQRLFQLCAALSLFWIAALTLRFAAGWYSAGVMPAKGDGYTCIIGELIMGSLPAIGLFLISRTAAPTRLTREGFLIGIAAFGGSALGLQLFCWDESSLHIIVYHLLPAAALCLLCTIAARTLLKWN